MLDHLIHTISNYVKLSPTDEALCRSSFEPLTAPKNTILEAESHIPRHLYFIVSGYVRLFSYTDQGEEVTTHLNCPPGFITAYQHFNQQTRSEETVECITDCQLLRISKTRLDALIQQSDCLKDFSIMVFQQSIAYNENRSKELATLSAEQRYRKLITQHPEMLQQVPIKHIASFLGMNPKSLSRIRKQIIR
jgi:CRP-like cAMP-binding protein